jgi:hypothetical protein
VSEEKIENAETVVRNNTTDWTELVRNIFGYTLLASFIIGVGTLLGRLLYQLLSIKGFFMMTVIVAVWKFLAISTTYCEWLVSPEYRQEQKIKESEEVLAYWKNLPEETKKLEKEIENYKEYDSKVVDLVFDDDSTNRKKHLLELQNKLSKYKVDLEKYQQK